MVICHVTWHLKWDRKSNPMLRHFAGNSGFSLCPPFYAP